jgi:hypothetical protein
MCGPSSAMKDINTKIQSLATQMSSEAKTVFSTASSTVDKILGSVSGIIAGGPSQAGFSQTELNAKNATAINAGAAEARNLKAAAGSSIASIGGGNTVMPSGTTADIELSASQKAAEDTANAENKIQQESYQRGNDNYWKGIDTAGRAPEILGVSKGFNESAMAGEHEAATSQQHIDTQNNWWKDELMKAGTAAAGMATGGFGNMLSDSNNSFLSGVGDAMTSGKG